MQKMIFIVSFIFSLLGTWIAIDLAKEWKFYDYPAKDKIHTIPTPLLGGLAVFMATFLPLVIFLEWDKTLTYIFLGAGTLLIMGLIDDKINIKFHYKLLVQVLVVLFVIDIVKIDFLPRWLSLPITFMWIIGVTNAFNLIDNMNGLSAGTACVCSAIFALLTKNPLCWALCGGCAGFLRYNLKGRIFLGDGGSLFIGYTLACIALTETWKYPFIPVLMLIYPIFDTSFVIIRRLIEGRSIFQRGKDHTSHVIRKLYQIEKEKQFILFFIDDPIHVLTMIFDSIITVIVIIGLKIFNLIKKWFK